MAVLEIISVAVSMQGNLNDSLSDIFFLEEPLSLPPIQLLDLKTDFSRQDRNCRERGLR